MVFGIVQEYAPVLTTDESTSSQFAPALTLYSMRTFGTLLLRHVMVSVSPALQRSPPFGERTVMDGRAAMVNTEAL